MNQYFVDYEVYTEEGKVIKWGNSFCGSDSDDINHVQSEIRKDISRELNAPEKLIRFRAFNKI